MPAAIEPGDCVFGGPQDRRRLIRVILFTLVLTALLACSSIATAGGGYPKTHAERLEAQRLKSDTAEAIVATWRCEEQLGRPHSFARSPWKPHTLSYRRAELVLWQKTNLPACLRTLHARVATIQRLEAGFAHYYRTQGYSSGPFTGHGAELERAARRTGWSPYFIAAASVTESSMGLAPCSNRRNVWGLASCAGSWGPCSPSYCPHPVPTWSSWEAAFEWYGGFLAGRSGVTSGWPSARTTYDFGGYAACSQCWGEHTAGHMRSIFGVDSNVRYAV